jgi:IclR family acetate operon transcriptional repressor
VAEPYGYSIEAVENAAKTLLMLTERPSVRAIDVATELGVSRSTAHRMVSTLAQVGLLRRNESDKSYSAGYALSQLALAVIGAADIRSEVEPVLAQLAAQTGETAHFLVREGDEVVFVAVAEGTFVVRAASRVGVRLPAHITSSGKSLLAALPREELLALYPVGRTPAGGTSMAIHTRDELLSQLDEVVERGYAVNRGESEPGLTTISVAIHDARGAGVGALTISGPSDRIEARLEELAAALRAAARHVEAAISRGMRG